jgi:hypothetical protein
MLKSLCFTLYPKKGKLTAAALGVVDCGAAAARVESVAEVDRAGWLVDFAGFVSRLHGLDLLRIGRDQAGFGWAGHDLNVDVVLAGKKQALADRELAEALALLASQLEDVAQYVDRRG